MPVLFDIHATSRFLETASEHSEKTAPTVAEWANDLFIRLGDGAPVLVKEILVLGRLCEDEVWMHANLAANAVYHLQHALGKTTVGHAGF